MEAAEQTFGERLRTRREASGRSLADVTYEIRAVLPRAMWCSLETIRRMENGTRGEEKADPVLVTALAEVYGCAVQDLSPVVAAGLADVRSLITRANEAGYSGGSATRV